MAIEEHKESLNIGRELIRALPIIGAAAACLASDPGSIKIIAYMVGILLVVAYVSHLIRKVLFPYLDLKVYVKKAAEEPRASGLVFLGMSIILSVMIYSATELLR